MANQVKIKCLLLPVLILLTMVAGTWVEAAPLSVTSGIFLFDWTGPESPILISPAPNATINALPVRLEVTATDAVSGVEAFCFEYSSSSNSRTSGWVPESSTEPATTFLLNTLPAGDYTWRCKARDRMGNEGAWSTLGHFVLTVNNTKTDTDADELPDDWELSHFGRLDYSNGIQDSDGDGVTDAEEYVAGTNPLNFTVDLVTGWNLLSLPVKMDAESADALHAAAIGDFWVYDGNHYQGAEMPEGYQGFWVYATQATNGISITGTVPSSDLVTLYSGWTMTGPGFNAHLPPLETNPIYIYYWNNRYFESAPDHFAALTGYWIFSLGGTLDFGQLRAP